MRNLAASLRAAASVLAMKASSASQLMMLAASDIRFSGNPLGKRSATDPAERCGETLLSAGNRRDLERGADAGEGRAQVRANGGNGADDHHGDERGDEAVFDRGGATLIAGQLRDSIAH